MVMSLRAGSDSPGSCSSRFRLLAAVFHGTITVRSASAGFQNLRTPPPGADRSHFRPPLPTQQQRALARHLRPRRRRQGSIVLMITPLATLLASPWHRSRPCRPAISATGWTPCWRFSPRYHAGLAHHPAVLPPRVARRPSDPIPVSSIFFAFPIVLLSMFSVACYRAQPGGAVASARADLVRQLVSCSRPSSSTPRPPEAHWSAPARSIFSSRSRSPRTQHLSYRAQPDLGHQDAPICFAAETRGEKPMVRDLRKFLPNARGPLIVDACLRSATAPSCSARSATPASA